VVFGGFHSHWTSDSAEIICHDLKNGWLDWDDSHPSLGGNSFACTPERVRTHSCEIYHDGKFHEPASLVQSRYDLNFYWDEFVVI